jgi:hypothetical protein
MTEAMTEEGEVMTEEEEVMTEEDGALTEENEATTGGTREDARGSRDPPPLPASGLKNYQENDFKIYSIVNQVVF